MGSTFYSTMLPWMVRSWRGFGGRKREQREKMTEREYSVFGEEEQVNFASAQEGPESSVSVLVECPLDMICSY